MTASRDVDAAPPPTVSRREVATGRGNDAPRTFGSFVARFPASRLGPIDIQRSEMCAPIRNSAAANENESAVFS
jgi:hypothetical protein